MGARHAASKASSSGTGVSRYCTVSDDADLRGALDLLRVAARRLGIGPVGSRGQVADTVARVVREQLRM